MAEHLAAWLLWQTLELGAHIGGLFGGEDDATPKNEPEWIRHWKFFYSLQSQCYSSKMLTNTLFPSPLGFYGHWPLFPGGKGSFAPAWNRSQLTLLMAVSFGIPLGGAFFGVLQGCQ